MDTKEGQDMKKFLIVIVVALAATALVACTAYDTATEHILETNASVAYSNSLTTPPETIPTNAPTDPAEIPILAEAEASPEEMLEAQPIEIQTIAINIACAEKDLLANFTNLHRTDLDEKQGMDAVIWANRPMEQFSIQRLEPHWGVYGQWRVRPSNISPPLDALQPGDAFVVENYLGFGVYPRISFSFYDPDTGAPRVFAFTINQAYPDGGNKWWLHELTQDQMVPQTDGQDTYTVTGQGATHVSTQVLARLGIGVIHGGDQVILHYHGTDIGIILNMLNYQIRGENRVTVGIDDAFMVDRDCLTEYFPLTLLRYLGFTVEVAGSQVFISGQLDTSQRILHPLAPTLATFIANTLGETKAFITHIDGTPGILAVQFADSLAEATIFAYVDAEVIYKKIGKVPGFPRPVSFATNGWGTILIHTEDGAASFSRLNITQNPTTHQQEITALFTIYSQQDNDGNFTYYHFEGCFTQGLTQTANSRNLIFPETFYMIRERLSDTIYTEWHREDTTALILDWTQRTTWNPPAEN